MNQVTFMEKDSQLHPFYKQMMVMKAFLILILFAISNISLNAQPRTIHVMVALADNDHQGIVPVPSRLGDGLDPANNLYWGAMYGVKSFLIYRTDQWKLLKSLETDSEVILERLLFKHKAGEIYLLADAYKGQMIKNCVEDFLRASNNQNTITIQEEQRSLLFGGSADLLAYVGHDGLMDFNVNLEYKSNLNKNEVMILACYSKDYFKDELKKSGAIPVLWTTHLMAPEAYTLVAAIEGWIKNEELAEIDERAAQAYHHYQKCGIRGARNLFTTGF